MKGPIDVGDRIAVISTIVCIVFLILWLFLTSVHAQSEHLDDPVNYEALEYVLEGCRHNLPLYFDHCIQAKQPYSEHQIGKAIKKCNVEAWHKFFACQIKGGFPYQIKKTLSEEIEDEVK